jgi:Flp pilus assembly protein TadG
MKHSKQTGAVFIELAIVLPLLIFLMLAAIDFSRAISEYKTIVNQAKSAARYLTTRAPEYVL